MVLFFRISFQNVGSGNFCLLFMCFELLIWPVLLSCPLLFYSLILSNRENYTDTSIYTDSFSVDDPSENHTSIFFDAKGDGKDSEASFSNSTRPLTESEKSELIFKNHFLTILLPINRFAEMGPSSRTFFSHNGFTCLQVLDHIRAFYQENMSRQEIGAAIHSDSRHADRIRSMFKIPFYPNSSNPKLDFACSSLHNNKHHSNRYHF
ncbi:hypothetical protein JHK82_048287 [Glycine max]|uniref:Uncharacterized protein n=2 Tax=Glycine subgen. Soja TaxID=1462606 RepID=A0A0R0FFY5_SOYBN|nr:hypothetical protein JHK86_048162 [Glycine max]KAG4933955.1 hypothetical protein JHK87_047957 [Glycine soja]KAG4944142.1 hypothetical protein JHK85_048788 [Glycine max]KAG5098433.1 hypothetical protein JHK82_048287 [Glycine max]KAG5103224.1 hypothetical protein JHK84_048193 [Glycine max]